MSRPRRGRRLIRICCGGEVYEIDESGHHKAAMPRAPRRDLKALCRTMDSRAAPSPPPEQTQGAARMTLGDFEPAFLLGEFAFDLPGHEDMFLSQDFNGMLSEPGQTAGDDIPSAFPLPDDGESATQTGDICWPLE
jgi:hypothetical protein